ncbi:MAG: hypothetical protein R6T83_04005 [Salinibacter sp.]
MPQRFGLTVSIGGPTPPTTVLSILLVLLPVLPAYSSPSPAPAPSDTARRGVVWHAPSDPTEAATTLDHIAATGADAVRLLHVPPDTVFARADALGLSLYVDLPVAHVSAAALSDSLRAAEPVLDRLTRRAARHDALRAIGLARHTDTTVPRACEILSRWSERIATESQLGTYYVTPFTHAADRCSGAVDRVLLDLQGHRTPVDRWHAWADHSPADARPSVGIGALGTWTQPGAASGLQVPHSAERQARYLETALPALFDAAPASPPLVFVHRWRDGEPSLLSSRRYGLRTVAGTARPAARVVEGLFTGSQRVFAFPSGGGPTNTSYGLVLLGWMLAVVLGGLYAGRPFARRTVSRYFQAHGFYRDAIRTGRDLEPGATAVVLSAAVVALGLMGVSAARRAAAAPAAEWVLAAVPEGLRPALSFGITYPEGLGLVLGGTVLWLLLLWATALALLARRTGSFSFSQGLMLVTWPCWPVFPGLPLALLAHHQSPVSGPVLCSVLGLAGLGAAAYFTTRVLTDYRAVTGLPWAAVGPMAVLSPPVLVLILAGGLVVAYDVPLRFLWRLATLT